MKPTPDLLEKIISDLVKAKGHLDYSFRKVQKIGLSPQLGEEELETLESFSSRFTRFSDIAINKYFRIRAIEKDPAFRGSVSDLLNLAEKYGWVESAALWRRIRELRNIVAHDYSTEDLLGLYRELVTLAPHLLSLGIAK